MSQFCQTCGACCARFRVSFYWAETDAHPEGRVPEHLTTAISPYHVAMRGSERTPSRCVALTGDIGGSVSCSIYPLRSSTCREFDAGDPRCAEARQWHGLPPLAADLAWKLDTRDPIQFTSPPDTGEHHALAATVADHPAHPAHPGGRSGSALGPWQGCGADLRQTEGGL